MGGCAVRYEHAAHFVNDAVLVQEETPPVLRGGSFLGAAHPNKPFIVFEGETFSFNQTDGLGSRVANDLQAQPGHRAGDTWVTNLAGSGWTGLSSGFHQPQHPQQGSAELPQLCRGSGVDSSRRY